MPKKKKKSLMLLICNLFKKKPKPIEPLHFYDDTEEFTAADFLYGNFHEECGDR